MLPLFDRTGQLGLPLRDALDRGAVILAANQRTARGLVAAYAADQALLSGIHAWPTPSIFEWSAWLAGLWRQYAQRSESAPLPLSSMQEQQLWKRVLGPDRDRVVAPDRMADLAQQAYALLGDYTAHRLRGAAAAGPFAETHEDAARFLVWAAEFDRLGRQGGWLSRSRMAEVLTREAALLDQIPEVLMVGFDRTTPAQAGLLAALADRGTRVHHYTAEVKPNLPSLISARDTREEIDACAWWCRAQLEAAEGRDGAPQRIAVITPDPAGMRGQIDHAFRRALMPQTTLWPDQGDAVEPGLPYEFSLGTPLAAAPRVKAALLLLRWLTDPLPAAELTWLLTSGFVADSQADDRALARLDGQLRREWGMPQVSLAALLQRSPAGRLPGTLRVRLERLRSRVAADGLAAPGGASTRSAAPSYARWAELVPGLLADAGWPGYRALDSYDYQVSERFTRLLTELAELGFDGSRPSWSSFLGTLSTQAQSVIFAAESAGPPIQVLGAPESSGQTFDAVWFLGADDQSWPAIGRPHPLLPGWLQREASMPHATPEADARLAVETTRRILSSAPVVVLSYSLQQGGIARRPSPLLAAIAQPSQAGTRVEQLDGSAPGATGALARAELVAVADQSGLLPWPVDLVAGGADVLKRQAACAFQSFATRRLHAIELEEPEPGLDARRRGTLIHSVLERLWTARTDEPERLHTLADLLSAIEQGSLEAQLNHHIDAALSELARAGDGQDRWRDAYLAVERTRVRERLLTWLDCEARRQPFTVAAVETQVPQIAVGALRLAVRPDRVDTLADGTRLLLDFKTGRVAANAWDGVRPEEPQLPLYAIFGGAAELETDQAPALTARVSGVAFAQIRAGETKLLARAEDPAGQVSASLGRLTAKNRFDDEIRDQWRDALAGLADGFVRGDAAVNPRSGLATCTFCPLDGLCRVRSGGLLDDATDDGSQDQKECAGDA